MRRWKLICNHTMLQVKRISKSFKICLVVRNHQIDCFGTNSDFKGNPDFQDRHIKLNPTNIASSLQ